LNNKLSKPLCKHIYIWESRCLSLISDLAFVQGSSNPSHWHIYTKTNRGPFPSADYLLLQRQK